MNTASYISHLEALTSELQGELKAKSEDLFEARQALITEGMMLDAFRKANYFMRQKIECALTCHPNAVKYLLEEALGENPNKPKA